MSLMSEERQAELVAEWLEQPPGTPPPEGVDAEVIEALISVRPELALPARVTADDILAAVAAGPMAKIDQTSPLLKAGSSLAAAPEDAPKAGDSKARRGWGFAAVGGITGMGVLLAAALALVVVAPTLMMNDEMAPMANEMAESKSEMPAAGVEEVAAAPAPPPPADAPARGRPALAKPKPRPVAKEVAEAEAPAVADLGDFEEEERLEELGYLDNRQAVIPEATQPGMGFGFAEGQEAGEGGLGLSGSGSGGGGASYGAGLADAASGKGSGPSKSEDMADGTVVGGIVAADDAVAMEEEPEEEGEFFDELAGADMEMDLDAPMTEAVATSSKSAGARREQVEEKRKDTLTRAPAKKRSSSKQDAAAPASAPMEPMPIPEAAPSAPAPDAASDLDGLRARAWPSGQAADATIQAALDANDPARAIRLCEEGLAQEVGNTPRRAMLLVLRGDAHRLRGDTNAARRDYSLAAAMNTAR